MRKRMLSLALVLCMVLSLALQYIYYIPVEASETTDAFGINTDVSDFDEEEALENNPYGTEEWVSLFTVSELCMSIGDDDSKVDYFYNYNTDGEVGENQDAQETYANPYLQHHQQIRRESKQKRKVGRPCLL